MLGEYLLNDDNIASHLDNVFAVKLMSSSLDFVMENGDIRHASIEKVFTRNLKEMMDAHASFRFLVECNAVNETILLWVTNPLVYFSIAESNKQQDDVVFEPKAIMKVMYAHVSNIDTTYGDDENGIHSLAKEWHNDAQTETIKLTSMSLFSEMRSILDDRRDEHFASSSLNGLSLSYLVL